ncbi:hypothetical protein ElyMa_003684900 [Elysia marginata]|uniref:Uncharacterized protein n=1 Tax=Elysia marginata TaxID=1093978 RepID=A0AAV4F290_9GAST|nr:hypothetical protein ElyMa_003684900 [Elysia marginata]
MDCTVLTCFRQYRRLCPYIYEVNSPKKKTITSISTASVSTSHDNQAFDPHIEDDPEPPLTSLETEDRDDPKSMMNPLYHEPNGISRATISIEELSPKPRGRCGSDDTSSSCSGDGQPDGHPTETEGKNSHTHQNSQQTEVTVHCGWTAGETTTTQPGLPGPATLSGGRTRSPGNLNRNAGLDNGHHDNLDANISHDNQVYVVPSSEKAVDDEDEDLRSINTHKYETVDCSGFPLDDDMMVDSLGGPTGEELNNADAAIGSSNLMDGVDSSEKQLTLNYGARFNGQLEHDAGRTGSGTGTATIRGHDVSQNDVIVRQTVVQMEPILSQVFRQESTSERTPPQVIRSNAVPVAKIRTSTPALPKFDRQRMAAEEDEYDRRKNFRYIDDPMLRSGVSLSDG